jgi:hypothetical protein
MSTYRKEKNLIIFSLDGVKGEYKLDINTGVFYGVKGNPIKSTPSGHYLNDLFPYSDDCGNLVSVLRNMFSNYRNTSVFREYAEILVGADRLDAIGIPRIDYYHKEWFVYLGNHIKEVAAYYKANGEFDYRTFKNWFELEEAKKKYGKNLFDTMTPEMYAGLTQYMNDLTAEEMNVCVYYLARGKMWEYSRGELGRLREYIRLCRSMNKAPQKANNFMREYCETKNLYELRKIEFDNKQIANNYANHSKAWEFEYGDFTIVVPTCGQDIVTEGERMHHCVGGYVDRVVRNETYIVFVRRKNDIDTPYITCQVHLDGTIGQYFLAYDRYINTDEDKAFYKAFAEYLKEVWG